MRLPTVKTIREGLECDGETARAIRARLAINTEDGEAPANTLLRVNDLLDAYGVEYIPHRKDTSREAFGLYYVNRGDTYVCTLLYDYVTCSWRVSPS